MKNLKRILKLMLIIFVILSAFSLNESFAIVTDELEAIQIVPINNPNSDGTITNEEYLDRYDVFCCMHGITANKKELKNIIIDGNEDAPLDANNATSVTVNGYNFRGFWLKEQNMSSDLPKITTGTPGTGNYTIRNVKYTRNDDKSTSEDNPAKPEEAYILAEMEQNIYATNLVRDAVSFAETGDKKEDVSHVWYALNIKGSFTVTINGEELKIVVDRAGNYYKEVREIITDPFGLMPSEKIDLYKLNMGTIDLDITDVNEWTMASYVQKAWWLLDWVNDQASPTYQAPGGEKAVTSSQLSDEAKAFEAYMLSITGGSLDYVNQTYNITESDGSIKTGTVNAPKIDSDKFDWDTRVPKENAEVHYDSDTQLFKIGPFSIIYENNLYKHEESGKEVMFSGITGSKVISNIGELTKKDGSGTPSVGEYTFLHDDGKMDNSYPTTGEKFYIVTPYQDDLKEIVDIEFSFKYMNAGAEFAYYEAEGDKEVWGLITFCTKCGTKYEIDNIGVDCSIHSETVCSKCMNDCDACNGTAAADTTGATYTCICKDRIDVYLKRESIEKTNDIQTMAHGLKAARWYEYKTININKKWDTENPNKGDLKIVKKLEDESGKPIQVSKDTIYKFKVTTMRANNDGEYKNTSGGYLNKTEEIVSVKVEKGSSTGSLILPAEKWEGDKAPLYEVEEIEAGAAVVEEYDYASTKIDGGKGEYKVDDATTSEYEGALVTVTNIYSNDVEYEKGKLQIEKKVVNASGTEIELIEEKVFEFEVKITTDGKVTTETAKIVVPKGSKSATWVSSEYTWEKGKTATYEIIEKPIPGYSLAGTLSGNLVNNDIKEVIAKNKEETKKAKIKIQKKLEQVDNSTGAVSDYSATSNETFSFELYINGQYYRDVTVTVPAGSSSAWSDEIVYEWTGDEDPVCKVVEKEHGKFIFSKIEPLENTLTNGSTASFVVTNRKKDVGNSGSLKIVKNVNEPVKVETPFEFLVTIDGKTTTEKVIIPKGDTTGFWLSEDYSWEGSAPSYEVKEINIPSNYEFVKISDSDEVKTNQEEFVSGSLKNNAEPVIVTAENKINDNEKGKIKIVKNLKDSDGNTFVADKPYTFDFEITVEGKGSETKTITIKEGESEGYVFSSEYTWKAGEAPKYKVEETNCPDDFKPTLTNAVGILSESSENIPVQVDAVNKSIKGYEATIKLYKTLIGEDGNPLASGAAEKSDFYFRVYVTENDGKEEKYDVTVTLLAGENHKEESVKDSSGAEKIFTWKEGEKAPTFRVEEKTRVEVATDSVGESIPDEWEWKEIAIENDNNELKAGENVVNCYNSEGRIGYKGELLISKILVDKDGNEVKGKDFTFTVKVGDYPEETITVKAGDSSEPIEYTWFGETAPEYTITETVPDGYEFVSMIHKYQEKNYSEDTGSEEISTSTGNPGTGTLKADNTVVVEVKNKFDESAYKGNLYINKILEIEDKLAEADIENVDKTFGFKVTVYYDNPEQYFTYDGIAYNSKEIFTEIVGTGSVGPITIDYYEEGNGPKYVVEEISMPTGWQLVSAQNASGKFEIDNENVEAYFTNKLPGPNSVFELTMELGGYVWNDTDYSNGKPSDSGHDGIRNNEPGIANVIVKVFRKGESDPAYTLLTDSNGRWQIPSLNVPKTGEKYYVSYTYDGQTYEPTILLASGSASNYSDPYLSEAVREKYLNDSMAKEIDGERTAFNNKFAKIWGESPIRDDGTTTGKSSGYELEYISRDIEYGGYSKKVSELITVYQEDDPTTPLDDTGTAKYPMTASTKNVGSGLYYPFNNRMTLISVDKSISEDTGSGLISYKYHAAFPYLNNINLGLLERPHADIAIEKDLEEAIVVVNGKIYKYKYGEIANAQFEGLFLDDDTTTPLTEGVKDLLYKQIQVNQKNINYTLNLYKSDYYYRASVYNNADAGAVDTDGNGTADDNIGSMLHSYIQTTLGISEGLDSLNLDVYLTYKISVTNESDKYKVEVHEISDYVDSSLELVAVDEIKYIDNIDGTPAGSVVVAKGADWTWTKGSEIEDKTAGWRNSAPVKYIKYTTTSLSGTKLASGETVSSKLTFKVNDKVTDILGTGIDNCIELGDKYNIVEIDNYSTYYTDGKVAGRVDEDSAPGNIDIENKNSINWYEDDTDRSPLLKIGLYEEVRNINGIAWEDLETNTIEYRQEIGDGLYDEASEELIPNMTTTLVEKVTIDGMDYDFIWPTEENMADLNSRSVENLTTFDSTTVTGDTGDELGKYTFTGIPAGDYVVRFTYGDENTLKQAVDEDGNPVFDDNGNIVYEKDLDENIKYSGQDYKSTTYQAENIVDNDENDDGFIDNEWHDLESEFAEDLAEARVSDARDDESRRLEVIAKSQNMFYENTSIMDTGTNSYNQSSPYIDDDGTITDKYHFDDSLKTYYMISNTAKLNMNIESVLNSKEGIVDLKTASSAFFSKNSGDEVGGVKVHVLNTNRRLSNEDSINVKFITYDVNNIDLGVETRSKNNIKLDKQIEQITLKTSAGDILIDAIYDIKYEHDEATRVGELRVEEDAEGIPILDENGEYILKPLITLKSESVGTENLQALNKTTRDLGFRYLNVDKDLLQGATITIKYRVTALNTGEVDRCNIALINLGEFLVENPTTPGEYEYLANFVSELSRIRDEEAIADTGYRYGQYLGQVYYQGANYDDTHDWDDAVVTSKVKQVIDYVDNDVVFSQMENVNKDTSWANTSTADLEEKRYIDNSDSIIVETETINHIIEETLEDGTTVRKIVDSRGVAYESEAKNNLIVSVENITGDTLANPELIKPLTPYDSLGYIVPGESTALDNNSSYINVTVSRYYSSDMDIEEIENISETLKLYNDVGRRDLGTIQGNAKPALGAMELLSEELDEHGNPIPKPYYENDTAVTELITLSPPTGTVITAMLLVQIMAIVLVAVTILAGGIVLIKRKVLIK